MTEPSAPHDIEPPSRHACEPCRRKKIKCPAERPACSCCTRLRQACTYRTRTARPTPTRKAVRRASTLRDRFQRLESQVQDIYGLLKPPTDGPAALFQSPTSSTDHDTRLNTSPQTDTSAPDSIHSTHHAFDARNLDPTSDILAQAVDVYRAMIHLQPLPIFRTSDLVHYLTVAPQFLLHSFLALVLTLKRPGLYCDPFSERIQLYTESAEEAVRKLAAKGASTIEVIQSLCLLSLRDILVCQPYQAQMTIGTASRLEACRTQSATVSLDGLDRDLSLRCRWSVYILESIFSPRLCAAEELHVSGFNFPISSPVPPALHPTRNENYPSDLYNAYDSKNDFGIITYYTKMVSIWRHLSIWLNHIRLGKEEAPWLPESGYAKLVAKVYERDSQLPAKHLLRNVSFSNRSPIEVSEQHEYWVPWVLMQLQCHAYLAILNHPFIHLVAVRNCSKGSQSGMFLQQTLDSALFNSGWVFRFLQLCEGHQLDLCDPFLGHLIATVATIPWLLQFVEDEKISLKASQDLILCKSFLKRLSSLWPHISQKLEILERLQITAEYHRRDLSNNGRAIKFPPSLLWELLDPHICQMNSQKPSPTDEPVVEQAPDARIQITTHLTHPLAESQDAATFYDADVDVDQATLNVPEELEQMYIDDLFNDFMQTMSFNTTV